MKSFLILVKNEARERDLVCSSIEFQILAPMTYSLFTILCSIKNEIRRSSSDGA